MATEEVGLRLTLQGRREAAAGLADVKGELDNVSGAGKDVASSSDAAARGLEKASDHRFARGFSAIGRGIRGIAGYIGRGLVTAAKTATAAVTALTVTALYKGFRRLESIDQATAKLSGLGNSAKKVDKIMSNALTSVRGTAFGLDEAATVSASAVAAGIKPGRDLTKTLKLVADAATIGGTSMSEMGSIFNKVAASNKIQGDVIAQLNDKGIPIIQLLGKRLGVTSAEVTKMASKGKIDFATFQKAMQDGLGGAAKKSGKTFSGSLANVGASLSRVGAGLLGGIFPHLAPTFQGITKALEPLEGKAARVGDVIGRKLGPSLEQIGPYLSRLTSGGGLKKFQSGLDGLRGAVGGLDLGRLKEPLKGLGDAFKSVDFTKLGGAAVSGAADTISVFSVAIGFAADHVDTLAKYMPLLVGGFVAYKTAQASANVLSLASIPLKTLQIASQIGHTRALRQNTAAMIGSNATEKVGMLTRARGVVVTIASTAAGIAASAATKVWAAGQWILNAALSANPIGLVVIAIAGLALGIYALYKKSETFRTAISILWNGVLKPFGSWLASKIPGALRIIALGFLLMAKTGVTGFRFLLKVAFAVFDGILSAAEKGLGWVPGLGDKIRSARGAFQDFGNSTMAKLDGVNAKIQEGINKANELGRDRTSTLHFNIVTTGTLPSGASYVEPHASIPGRARGGPVLPGRPYIVGEHRPEVFVPNVGGRIMSRIPVRTLGGPDRGPEKFVSAEHGRNIPNVAALSAPRMPDPVSLDLGDDRVGVSVGPGRDGQPLVVQVSMDGKVVTETAIEGIKAKVARK